jgi:hypothetical protein
LAVAGVRPSALRPPLYAPPRGRPAKGRSANIFAATARHAFADVAGTDAIQKRKSAPSPNLKGRQTIIGRLTKPGRNADEI